MRVALFITCIGDTFFPEAGRATVQVLERLGHEVVFPGGQTCCGQMHLNSGYPDAALALARRWADLFEDAEVVVAPSSSCVGTVRELYPELARRSGDGDLARRLHELGERTFELSELLVRVLGVQDVGATFPHRVAYHPTCHSLRLTKAGEAPLQLLRHVRRLDLVELPRGDECCGFGGTFALKNADTSAAMLADKVASVRATDADVCTALDGSCLLHIEGGLSRAGTSVRAVHLAEILASA
jgi:L-lactate dehydrogenase complex protein LldE